MSAELFFFLGLLSGVCVTGYVAVVLHVRRVAQLMHEFTTHRENLRRQAFARGYEERAMLDLNTKREVLP